MKNGSFRRIFVTALVVVAATSATAFGAAQTEATCTNGLLVKVEALSCAIIFKYPFPTADVSVMVSPNAVTGVNVISSLTPFVPSTKAEAQGQFSTVIQQTPHAYNIQGSVQLTAGAQYKIEITIGANRFEITNASPNFPDPNAVYVANVGDKVEVVSKIVSAPTNISGNGQINAFVFLVPVTVP